MKVRQAQKLRNWLLIIGTVIMLGAYIYEPLLAIGILVSFSCLIPHFLFNKCPHCRRQLGHNEAKYCQYCGKPIDLS